MENDPKFQKFVEQWQDDLRFKKRLDFELNNESLQEKKTVISWKRLLRLRKNMFFENSVKDLNKIKICQNDEEEVLGVGLKKNKEK
jgi:hypothetical protein